MGAQANPLRHLGTVACGAFWLLAATGVVLYAVLDTSVQGAWTSIEALHDAPLHAGQLLRGLHRYAADLLVLATLAHLLREWLHAHERGARRYTWLTGVPLIAFAAASGVGGFWLNWDQLGQYSAMATAAWVDALPLLSSPLSRNFLDAAAVGDRLFSLFVFVHLGVPLLMLFGLWFHVQRLSRAAVLPPRPLAVALAAALAAAALLWPVVSHPPALAGAEPAVLRLDWVLLLVHPLTEATSPAAVWALVLGGAVLLFVLPFLPQPPRPPVAEVAPQACNGCTRCVDDCPYAAITMVPHPNQRIGRQLAVVDADLCVGCGICAGACPSGTPFRSAGALVNGIDLPGLTVDALRSLLRGRLAAARDLQPVVVFGCAHGARLPVGRDVVAMALPCAAQLPPSFVEYALRDGAGAVVVAACRESGCEFRLGERITAERLHARREPHLRLQHLPAGRVVLAHAGAGDEAVVAAAVQRLRAGVRTEAAS